MVKRVPVWAWFLIIGLLVVVPYVLVAGGSTRQICYDGVGVASIAAMVVGIRRNRGRTGRVARMTMLVHQVHSQAVVLEEQADQLREVAQQDPLTGLPNRRAWNAALASALQRAGRDGTPLTLAVLDLDHFKTFNDTHGHQAGDHLLKEAAAVWVGNLRAVDLVARYGGEEFVALLPGATTAEAAALLDRLRPLTPMDCTFSAGVASWNGSETAEELVARADRALYRAKGGGRDRVECDEISVGV